MGGTWGLGSSGLGEGIVLVRENFTLELVNRGCSEGGKAGEGWLGGAAAILGWGVVWELEAHGRSPSPFLLVLPRHSPGMVHRE